MQGGCYLNGGPVMPPDHQRLHNEAMEDAADKIDRSYSDLTMTLIMLAVFGLVLLAGFAVVDSLDVLEEVRNACHSSTTSA